MIVDKEVFPRNKVCAGWVTPAVFSLLGCDPVDYGQNHVCQPISGFRVGRIGDSHEVCVDYGRAVSYGIRRSEFDYFLLQRAGARLSLGKPVRTIQRAGDVWVVDERIRAPMLIAAGGHFCPVAKWLGELRSAPVVATKEVEFLMSEADMAGCRVAPDVPELYFCRDLRGYGWCFRKGNYLNIGLGREGRARISRHVDEFCDWLQQRRRIQAIPRGQLRGHAYYLRGHSPRRLSDTGLLAIGDAAGLAYTQSGEGIRPAVESGLMAARTVLAAAGNYERGRLKRYEDALEKRYGRVHLGRSRSAWMPPVVRDFLAARLLTSPYLVRHVVLDRWFLRDYQPPL
jgi:flavin-dependent dehydrogenase